MSIISSSEKLNSSHRCLLQTELPAVFGMAFRSLGLLEVCMMIHRAPLSTPSTTHEPWPLIQHMWMWDTVAIANGVSEEALARCPWIVRVNSFECVCRCIMTTVLEMCERKRAVDALPVHRLHLPEDWLRVFVWSLLGQKGLCLTEKEVCHPSFLMLCLCTISLPLSKTPPTFLHLHVKLIQIPDAHYI